MGLIENVYPLNYDLRNCVVKVLSHTDYLVVRARGDKVNSVFLFKENNWVMTHNYQPPLEELGGYDMVFSRGYLYTAFVQEVANSSDYQLIFRGLLPPDQLVATATTKISKPALSFDARLTAVFISGKDALGNWQPIKINNTTENFIHAIYIFDNQTYQCRQRVPIEKNAENLFFSGNSRWLVAAGSFLSHLYIIDLWLPNSQPYFIDLAKPKASTVKHQSRHLVAISESTNLPYLFYLGPNYQPTNPDEIVRVSKSGIKFYPMLEVGDILELLISPDGNYLVGIAGIKANLPQSWYRQYQVIIWNLELRPLHTWGDTRTPVPEPDIHSIGFDSRGRLNIVHTTNNVLQLSILEQSPNY